MSLSIKIDWCMDAIYQNPSKLTPRTLDACEHYGIPKVVVRSKLTDPTPTAKPDRFDLIQQLAREWKSTNHYGYPIPDERGRPKLNWLKCAHPKCTLESCKNPSELAQHLKANQAYTRGFHLAHESALERTKLTADQIRATNLTQCPSLICDISSFRTPDDLIYHLTRLGMCGFWESGITVPSRPDELVGIIATDKCIICMQNVPDILFIPCGHSMMCADCYKPTPRCLMCQKTVCNGLLI